MAYSQKFRDQSCRQRRQIHPAIIVLILRRIACYGFVSFTAFVWPCLLRILISMLTSGSNSTPQVVLAQYR
jgi:hypothetical protein